MLLPHDELGTNGGAMSEAIIGFTMLGVLIVAFFAVDLMLSGRQRRRISAGGPYRGVQERHGSHGAANQAQTGSTSDGMSGSTYLG